MLLKKLSFNPLKMDAKEITVEKSDEMEEKPNVPTEATGEEKKNYEEIKIYGGRGEYIVWTMNYEELEKYREKCGQYSARSTRAIQKSQFEKQRKQLRIQRSEPVKLQRNQDFKDEYFSSLLRGLSLSNQHYRNWDKKVAGLHHAKQILNEAVVMPLHSPRVMFNGNRRPWDSVLLFGPPGTGKTKLARALEICGTFLLFPEFFKESEGFDFGSLESSSSAPTIIFADEIDLSSSSEFIRKAILKLKTHIEAYNQPHSRSENGRIFMLAATNQPWLLDDEVLKCFQKKIYTPLPNESERLQILKSCLGNTPHQMGNSDLEKLAKITDRYSGGDISLLVQDALMQPLRKIQSATHFKKVCHPSSSEPDMLTPCSPNCSGAVEISWVEIPQNKLLEPMIDMSDMLLCLTQLKPSIDRYDIQSYEYFQERFPC